MRFSMRERLRPTSCAACGLSQNPGTEICFSISCSELRAESRSKIAPDGLESVFDGGDFCKRFFFHFFLSGRIARTVIAQATHANQSPSLTYSVVDCRG